MRVNDLAAFIIAREEVRLNKEAGSAPPWTEDPILQKFRFCNVRREHDAVTKWIRENWRTGHAGEQDLWFAMAVARLFNLPSTLEFIGYPAPWRSERTRDRLRLIQRGERGEVRVFNAAYIVSTNGIRMDKIDYVIDHILDPLWEARKLYRPRPDDTLASYHARLVQARGLGSFMAAQVIADIKYDITLSKASDWDDWAASGPGSRRGLNRVMGRPFDARWNEANWLSTLRELRKALLAELPSRLQDLHAQDVQNCLCEFDKYERVRLHEGTPKQLYKEKK